MVQLRIKIFIVLCFVLISCAFFLKKAPKSNLVDAVLPKSAKNYEYITSISKKSDLLLNVIYEAQSESDLQKVRDVFLKEIKKEPDKFRLQKETFDFEKLICNYLKSPENFLSKDARNMIKKGQYAALRNRALRALYSPASFEIAPFEDDPYLLLDDFLKSTAPENAVRQIEGKYYSADDIYLQDYSKSKKEIAELIKIKDRLSAENSKIYLAGTPVHTYITSARAGFSINIISFLLVCFVVWITHLYFKTAKPVIAVLLSIAFGYLCGFCALKIFFPDFHLLTLVFATVLIGIGVDYSYHYMFFEKHDKTFFNNLALSFCSTILAFLILYFSGIEIMRQISVFIIAGLFGIFFFIVFLYPCFNFEKPALSLDFKFPRAVLFIILIFASFGILKLKFNDSLSAFYVPQKALMEAQNILQKVKEPYKFALVRGKDIEEILQKEEKACAAENLADSEYIALSKYFPSKKRQIENSNLVSLLYQNDLKNYGLVDDASKNKLLKQKFIQIAPPEILKKHFLLDCNTSLFLAKKVPSGFFEINIQKEISKYLKTYRHILLLLLPVVFFAVFCAAFFAHGAKKAFKIILPPVSGSFCAVGLLSLFAQEITMFGVIALFLVLGFTIDYSIFSSGGDKNSKDAVLISCATTSFSFLLLSFCGFRFISSISLILFSGIVISYITGLCVFGEEIEQT